MSGRGHLSECHGPREMSPSQREGKWGLNLVNGSALAILVVRGAAERFATLCVPFVFCFVFFLIKGKLAMDASSAHVTGCKLSVPSAPPRLPHGCFQL